MKLLVFTMLLTYIASRYLQDDDCSNISDPISLNDCFSKSTTANLCCFNKNNNSKLSNKCNYVASSAGRIVNGTTLNINDSTYTQICLNETTSVLATTCGKENPLSYDDCKVSSTNTLSTTPYLCCFSKITISGTSKSSCVIREITQNMIRSYKTGGLEFTCPSNNLNIWAILLFSITILLIYNN